VFQQQGCFACVEYEDNHQRIVIMRKLGIALLTTTMLAAPAAFAASNTNSDNNGNQQPPQGQQTQQMQKNNSQNRQSGQSQQNQQSAESQQNGRQQSAENSQPISPQSMSRGEVKQVQQALDKDGFKAGPTDGRWGHETASAVKQFQHSKQLQPTGQLNGQTVADLGLDASKFPQPQGQK